MPRNYKHKKPAEKRWKEEDLKAAVEKVWQKQLTISAAAKQYNIPRTTLADHVHRRRTKVGAGRPTILTPGEEKELVVTCQVLQRMGFGLTREAVSMVVQDYIKDHPERDRAFGSSGPGYDWWKSFSRRWPDLTTRKPQHLGTQRAKASTRQNLDEWYEKVKKFFEEVKLTRRGRPCADFADRVWNCDETGFCLGVTAKRVLAKKGANFVHDTSGGSDRSYITVHCCGSASGIRLPPYILYKGKYLYKDWMIGGPAGALYGVSDSGWMEHKNFQDWFIKGFLPAVRHLTETGPVALFFDGHNSHLAISLIETARDAGVDLFTLPSNTSHILQPLDVAVYGPMKTTWRQILQNYKLTTKASKADKKNFASLLAELLKLTMTPAQLRSGFRATGICPFNPKAVPDDKLASSIPFSFAPAQQTAVAQASSGPVETPIRTYLTGYFTELLQPKQPAVSGKRQDRIRPVYYGEALTRDEVFERIQEAEDKKKRAAEEKKGRKGRKGKNKQAQEPQTPSIDTTGLYNQTL